VGTYSEGLGGDSSGFKAGPTVGDLQGDKLL